MTERSHIWNNNNLPRLSFIELIHFVIIIRSSLGLNVFSCFFFFFRTPNVTIEHDFCPDSHRSAEQTYARPQKKTIIIILQQQQTQQDFVFLGHVQNWKKCCCRWRIAQFLEIFTNDVALVYYWTIYYYYYFNNLFALYELVGFVWFVFAWIMRQFIGAQ